MAELQGTAVIAWVWFAMLAAAGQLWPMAGHLPDNARTLLPRFITNMALTASDLALAFFVPAISILAAILGDANHAGLLQKFALPFLAQFILAFVLSDITVWAVHRLAHCWHPFWRVHRIHHSDTELDVLTTYRQHPLASLVSGFLIAGVTLCLGLNPIGVVAYQLVLAFHNPLQHANIDWPVPDWIVQGAQWLFVTPGQHALHHSALQQETDSNFGQVFSIWDRLAGTLRIEDRAHLRAIEIGLGSRYAGTANNLWRQWLLPVEPIKGPEMNGTGKIDTLDRPHI